MKEILKSNFDAFNEITLFEFSEDEEYDYAIDDLDLDLSDASDNTTVLD